MLRVVRRTAKRAHIDLETVRETLLYMESDCKGCPGLEGVAAAIGRTIVEIDRVNASGGVEAPAQPVTARFIPAGL